MHRQSKMVRIEMLIVLNYDCLWKKEICKQNLI